jgi:hypothetical protein
VGQASGLIQANSALSEILKNPCFLNSVNSKYKKSKIKIIAGIILFYQNYCKALIKTKNPYTSLREEYNLLLLSSKDRSLNSF